MEIGNKLKDARVQSNFTQEQVAESLGVSRQTISNWENNKTYPDIISVIQMSDLYDISLDKLLKEEKKMSGYLEYLEESTNVVKSKHRLVKICQIGSYLVIWAVCILSFWFSTEPEDAMGYALVVFYMVLPVTTFLISFSIGKDRGWGRSKWWMIIFFGGMFMVAGYATFSLANMRTFDKINLPELGEAIPGMVISLIGMGIGTAVQSVVQYIEQKKSVDKEEKQ